MTNLLTLATQIEQATEDQQQDMLIAAWGAMFPFIIGEQASQSARWESGAKFSRMLAAKAYESAAIMLVPDGYDWDIGTERNRDLDASAWLNKGDNFSEEIFAATPALALAAACLRAKTQESE